MKMSWAILKKALLRSWFYFRTGYTTYLSLTLGIVSTAITAYYLLIQNVPLLEYVFPRFLEFLIVGTLCVGMFGTLLGYLHYKKLLKPFYKAEQDVLVESNQYQSGEIITPSLLPLYKAVSRISKKLDLDSSEVDEIIKKTEEKK